jgi:hypothetical protein
MYFAVIALSTQAASLPQPVYLGSKPLDFRVTGKRQQQEMSVRKFGLKVGRFSTYGIKQFN